MYQDANLEEKKNLFDVIDGKNPPIFIEDQGKLIHMRVLI